MNNKVLSGLVLAVSIVLLGALWSFHQHQQKAAVRFEKEVAEVRKNLHNVGLEVVVVKDNQIVYNQCFGYKNVEQKTPLTSDCLFRIASISKSFTTTSLMQLVEQGKVSLKTDVSELAGFAIRNPHFPDRVITLEMLLSHTSSICDDEGYFSFDVINPAENPNWAQCYRTYAPGEGYEYCNLNLNLAGSFIEKLSGERFHEYVVGHVLRPLGLYGGYMVDSLDASRFASLYQSPEDEDYDYADSMACGEMTADDPYACFVCTDADAYAPRTERFATYRMGYDTPLFSPTGGMKISAPDLARYMMMHMNYGQSTDEVRIIPEELAREMQTPRSTEENYGLSLWQTDLYSPGHTLVGHTGSAYGMRSAMFFDPEEKFGFVVISTGALEHPEGLSTADPSGSDAADDNILTATLKLLYKDFIAE